ncbi:MarR family winged helix-turn-helix transcriptional regulator [Allorhizocola rhizosphaerae]|uniref:MarR family winged helix-turn-helix transcriptional regulator n=1 Tax=Allorhizocola rhizosphaerae TaxID=1872709 RepID=UPI001B8D4D3A|nr:MarR family transcriptional regulator [Allorhizocola rhizosphaerae]
MTIDPADALIAAWRAELPDVLYPTSELTKRTMLLAARLDEATRRELPELGLTAAEFDILVSLRRSGNPYKLKPNQLASGLMLSTGGTSNVVNRLVRLGLVEREPDPDDRRSTLIGLTPKGVALAEQAVRAIAQAHADVFAGVPDEVVTAATDALRDLFAAMKRRPGNRGERGRRPSRAA